MRELSISEVEQVSGGDDLLGGYGLTRYSTRYSRFWGSVGRRVGNALSGQALGRVGIPSAGIYGFGGPLVGAIGYVLFNPSELADGTLPDDLRN